MARPLARSTLWTLLAGNTLVGVGVGFWLPILPLYVGSRGGTSILVGAVFAAGQLARGLVQYPAGLAADRFGRRPVILAAIGCYAAAFLLYLLPLPAVWLVAARFVHAALAGFYSPAAGALLADVTNPRERGSAFGKLRASDMLGIILGPALGGFVAGFRLDAVFVAGALVCAAAALLLLRLPRDVAHPVELDPSAQPPPLSLLQPLLPVIFLGLVMSYTIGTYDTVWSLYMTRNGATPFLVGLSFTVFALPLAIVSGPAGALADRWGARRSATVAAAFYGLFGGAYAFITSVPTLIALGAAEGTLIAGGQPALMGEVSRRAPPGAQGQTQGAYQTVQIAAIAAGALLGGYLYSVRPAYAFFGIFAAAVVGVSASLVAGRRP